MRVSVCAGERERVGFNCLRLEKLYPVLGVYAISLIANGFHTSMESTYNERDDLYTRNRPSYIISSNSLYTLFAHMIIFEKYRHLVRKCEHYIHPSSMWNIRFSKQKKKKKKELAKSTTLKLPRGFQGQSVRIRGLEAILSLLKLPFSWLHVQQCNQALYIVYYTVYLLLYIHYYASWRWTQPVHSY